MTCVDHPQQPPSCSDDVVPSLGAHQRSESLATDCEVLKASGLATVSPHSAKPVGKAVRYRIRVRGQVPKDLPSKLAAIQAAAILRSRQPDTKKPS